MIEAWVRILAWRRNVSPSITGISMSVRISVGRALASCCSATIPFSQVATTVVPGTLATMLVSSMRIIAESSTIITRASAMVECIDRLAPSCRGVSAARASARQRAARAYEVHFDLVLAEALRSLSMASAFLARLELAYFCFISDR